MVLPCKLGYLLLFSLMCLCIGTNMHTSLNMYVRTHKLIHIYILNCKLLFHNEKLMQIAHLRGLTLRSVLCSIFASFLIENHSYNTHIILTLCFGVTVQIDIVCVFSL